MPFALQKLLHTARLVRSVLIAIADLLLAPATIVAALLLKCIRVCGVSDARLSMAIFRTVGVFPILDHYYEPLFSPKRLYRNLNEPRTLPGIELDERKQCGLLRQFNYQEELVCYPLSRSSDRLQYYYHNTSYGPGDAECLYSMIRLFRLRRVIEIGSGHSTLVAAAALRMNRSVDVEYSCEHICIEPYERPWLEEVGVTVIRSPVERVDIEVFDDLNENDILFIDSSHIIRPQGDVLHVYQHILPRLSSGVLVHVHDIFTPRDYPKAWIVDRVLLWNEQYLLESFLAFNSAFEVVCALNHLCHTQAQTVRGCFPVYAREEALREPGAFWIRSRPRG